MLFFFAWVAPFLQLGCFCVDYVIHDLQLIYIYIYIKYKVNNSLLKVLHLPLGHKQDHKIKCQWQHQKCDQYTGKPGKIEEFLIEDRKNS